LSKFENIDDLTSDPRIRNKLWRVTAQPLQTVLPVMDRVGQPARAQFMPDVAPSDAPPFYMKSAQVLDSKIQGKAATADQVRAILKNPQNGIKAEELKWTGVEQAVERIAKENGGKVPKEALLRYLKEDGAVRLEEVTMGEQTLPVAEIRQMIDRGDRIDVYDQNHSRMITYDELGFYGEGERLTVRGDKTTRFGQYQLPGGENYREVVLAMPAQTPQFDPSKVKIERRSQSATQGSFRVLYDGKELSPWYGDYGGGGEFGRNTDSEIMVVARRNFETGDKYNKVAAASGAYTSSHFPDTPNYVAHARLNERADAAGKPGLFLEEIQSDRHQAGREKGYVDAAIRNEQEALLAKQTLSDGDLARIEEIKAMGQGDIPDAPFRKDWPMQMFKRALADAVGSGKEWIGWTTGETQAGRYDLSKQIDRLTVTEDQNIIGSYRVQAFKDGSGAIDKTVKGEELPDVIGKDLAQKAMDNIQESRQRSKPDYSTTLTGIDLKIGGEGMKGFYDQILPKEISKYVKQWGGQVEKAQIKPTSKKRVSDMSGAELVQYIERPNETIPIWRVNITPQMREGIKKAGQALFVGGAAAVVAEEEL
jgi:hypothetical protein